MAGASDPQEIQEAALEARNQGLLNKEFVTKQQARDLNDTAVERVLRSKSSFIGRYTDHGQPRYSFWHPETLVFVVWQPAEEGSESEIKTCFIVANGDDYIRDRRDFIPLRGFCRSIMEVQHQSEIEQMLAEYEITVTEILPDSSKREDDALIDEIGHLLSLRDWLEGHQLELVMVGLKQGRNLHEKLAEIDTELLKHRDIILNAYPDYQAERERLDRPSSAWWWWLDFPEAHRRIN